MDMALYKSIIIIIIIITIIVIIIIVNIIISDGHYLRSFISVEWMSRFKL